MLNILDDITFDDLQKRASDGDISDEKLDTNKYDFRIIESYLRMPRKKDVLLFALVRYGNYERYDIRVWYANESKPGKGMALTKEEIIKLANGLENFGFDEDNIKERAYYKSEKLSAVIYNQISLLNSYAIKGTKWNKEVNVVDFGYGKKIDLRRWSDDYSICGKGISISYKEAKELLNVLDAIQ